VIVGVMNRNQILHDFSCKGLRAGRLPCLHHTVEWPDRDSTNRPRNVPTLGSKKDPKRGRSERGTTKTKKDQKRGRPKKGTFMFSARHAPPCWSTENMTV